MCRQGTAGRPGRHGGDDDLEHDRGQGQRPGRQHHPAKAAERLLGVQPEDGKAEKRLNNLVHWAYGTGWGAMRGLLGAAGVPGPRAALGHLATVWGAEQVVLPALGVSSPAWRWDGREVAVDGLHHLVYASATSAAYAALERW